MLDVGAGTGLLALDAGRRVGATGGVIALDVSHDALVRCRGVWRSGEPLHPLVADAVSLPLAKECVDAVVARSVLIYVVDKAAAAAELLRVRPGGRASIFEPINSRYQWFADADLDDVEPTHRRVVEHWQAGGPGGAMWLRRARPWLTSWTPASSPSISPTRCLGAGLALVAQRSRRSSPCGRTRTWSATRRPLARSSATTRTTTSALSPPHSSRPSTSVSAGAYLRARRPALAICRSVPLTRSPSPTWCQARSELASWIAHAALTKPMWLKAWGKLPRSSPVSGSTCSARRPTSFT